MERWWRRGREPSDQWERGRAGRGALTPPTPVERRGRREAAAEEVDHLPEGPAALHRAGAAALQRHPPRRPAAGQFFLRSPCLRSLHLSMVSPGAGTRGLVRALGPSTCARLASRRRTFDRALRVGGKIKLREGPTSFTSCPVQKGQEVAYRKRPLKESP